MPSVAHCLRAPGETKAHATHLTAWAVTDREAEPRVYGVVVSNTSGSTFHDVSIEARMHKEQTGRPIEVAILPPGTYFVQHNRSPTKYTWSFAVDVAAYDGVLRPYMKSQDYLVTEVTFADNLNQRWSTNQHAVLVRREDVA
jgi:hypothetical protein